MLAVGYAATGEADVLKTFNQPVPEPGPGEIRVEIAVAGVNPTDWKTRIGLSPVPIPEGRYKVPGLDGAGVVDAVGPGVTEFRVGQRVWLQMVGYKRLAGTLQQYVVVPWELASPLSGAAPFELGAVLGVPFVTAHRALTSHEGAPARLAPGALAGRTVLAAGGAGAVGNATIQLARWAGAEVICTVSSTEKAALATAAGAHHVVNYRESDAAERIRDLRPSGVDTIVEVSPARNADLDLAIAAAGGEIVAYASDGGNTVSVPVGPSMGLNLSWRFLLLYTVATRRWYDAAAAITNAVSDGAVRIGANAGLPVHRFRLENAPAAHRAVEDGIVGKVVVDVGASGGRP